MQVIKSQPVHDKGNNGAQNTKIVLNISGYRPNYVENKIRELRPNCRSVQIDEKNRRLTAIFSGIEDAANLCAQLIEELRQPDSPAL